MYSFFSLYNSGFFEVDLLLLSKFFGSVGFFAFS